MEAVAKLNNCQSSPRKMRLVVDLIRGKKVEEAFGILRFNNKQEYASRLEKLLRSAVANAEQKELGDSESMVISRAFVNGGPIYRRARPRSMGRANAIQKRTSHITVVVAAPLGQGHLK